MSWGLVLSGGGAFGIANAGVIEVLEREKLRPDCIAGSSMGAIVGGLYALGRTPEEMRKLCESISLWNIAKMSPAPLQKGLHGGVLRQRLREILDPLVGNAVIGDCTIPFVCVAGRVREPIKWRKIIQSGFTTHVRDCIEKYVFPPETPMIDALLASSAIPVIFSPATVDKDTFVDLLSFGAVPCRTLRELHHPDRIIATDTNPRYSQLKNFLPPGWKEFLEEGDASLQDSLHACDLVLKPTLTGSTFSFGQAEKYYEEGKKEADQCLSDIRKLLDS